MNRIRSFVGLAAIAILAGTAALAQAQNQYNWNVATGSWTNSANWTPTHGRIGNDPGAIIENGGAANVGPGDTATDLGTGYGYTYIGDPVRKRFGQHDRWPVRARTDFLATRRAASAEGESSPNPLESTRQIPSSSLVP